VGTLLPIIAWELRGKKTDLGGEGGKKYYKEVNLRNNISYRGPEEKRGFKVGHCLQKRERPENFYGDPAPS